MNQVAARFLANRNAFLRGGSWDGECPVGAEREVDRGAAIRFQDWRRWVILRKLNLSPKSCNLLQT